MRVSQHSAGKKAVDDDLSQVEQMACWGHNLACGAADLRYKEGRAWG